jgi:hypothetical protein
VLALKLLCSRWAGAPCWWCQSWSRSWQCGFTCLLAATPWCNRSLHCASYPSYAIPLLSCYQVNRQWPHPNTFALFVTQSLGWRTMLVVPELEQELAVGEATRATQFELKMLRNARSDLDTQVRAAQLHHAQLDCSAGVLNSAAGFRLHAA